MHCCTALFSRAARLGGRGVRGAATGGDRRPRGDVHGPQCGGGSRTPRAVRGPVHEPRGRATRRWRLHAKAGATAKARPREKAAQVTAAPFGVSSRPPNARREGRYTLSKKHAALRLPDPPRARLEPEVAKTPSSPTFRDPRRTASVTGCGGRPGRAFPVSRNGPRRASLSGPASGPNWVSPNTVEILSR